MNHFDLPGPRNNDIIDKPQEVDLPTPPPEEIGETASGGLSESDNMLYGAFPVQESGIEVGDEPEAMKSTVAEGSPATAEVKGAPNGDSDEDGKKPESDRAPGQIPEIPAPGTAADGSGEGGGDEPPDEASGEMEGDDERSNEEKIRELHTWCMENIQYSLESIEELFRSTGETPTPLDPVLINEALINLAGISDPTVAREYSEKLINPTLDETVGMSFAQFEAGDPDGLSPLEQLVLTESLVAESRKAAERAVSSGTEDSHVASKSPARPILTTAMKACEDRGKSPHEFIEAAVTGITDDEERGRIYRKLLLEHASRVIPEGSAYAESIKEGTNELAREIPADKTLEEVPGALPVITSPELRQEKVDSYLPMYLLHLQQLAMGEGDTSAAEALLDAAPAMLNDSTLSPHELNQISTAVYYTKTVIDGMAFEAAQSNSQPPVPEATLNSLAEQAAGWQVEYAVHDGQSAESVAGLCAAEAHNNPGPLDKDKLLARAAQKFMERGDAGSARHLAEVASNPKSKLSILRACWHTAQTGEQVEQLKPEHLDPMQAEEGMNIGREYLFMSILKYGRPASIENLVQNIATGTYTEPDSFLKAEAVGMLMTRHFELNPERAITFAHDTVDKLSKSRTLPLTQDLQPFHDILCKSKDHVHLLLAYTSTLTSTGSVPEKLHALSRLARKLEPGGTTPETKR